MTETPYQQPQSGQTGEGMSAELCAVSAPMGQDSFWQAALKSQSILLWIVTKLQTTAPHNC